MINRKEYDQLRENTEGRYTVTIASKLGSGGSGLWYAEKLGETFAVSRFFSDGVYVRTGDFLNTGNLIFIKDIESIDQVKGSN
jgi:hypothetical protein